MSKSSVTISSPRKVETFGVRRAVVEGQQLNGRWSWTFLVEAKPNAEGVAPSLELGPIEHHVDDVSDLVGARLTLGQGDDGRGSIYVYDHLPLQNNQVFVERKRSRSLEVRWTATTPDPDRYDEGAVEHHVLVHANFRISKLETAAGGPSILFLEPGFAHAGVMAKFFRSRGHRTQTVSSVDEALASLANTSFDFVVAVFLDVPTLLGLCEAVRARGHTSKLLIGHDAEDGELPMEITAHHVMLEEVSTDDIMAAMSHP
jgi:CheY-like chemotaxis protein